jgi:hypothetical protein
MNNQTGEVQRRPALHVNPVWLRLLLVLAVLASPALTQAAVRLEVTGPPFYARFGAGEVYTDGLWVAIPFYRNPGCIPADFNLLDFFDPAAFDCESCVAGFEIWKNGPWAGDVTPIQSRLDNIAPMPFWFVTLAELEAAMGDGVLTIGELAGFESRLIGWAASFTETLHPYPGSQQSMGSYVASGLLEDGRQFSFKVTATEGARPWFSHLEIKFK